MILNKLIGTLLLGVACCSPTTYIQEPNRVSEAEELNFSLYNGTQYDLIYRNKSRGISYDVEAKSSVTVSYTFDTSDDWSVIYDGNWDDISDLWYECLDSIGIPQTPVWDSQPYGSVFDVVNMVSYCTGLGVYEEAYYPSDVDYFITPYGWGGIGKGLTDSLTFNLIPSGTHFRLYKENGSFTSLSQLKVKRWNLENNVNYATLVYAQLDGSYINIANNFGYKANNTNSLPQPTVGTTIQPYLLYYNDYTNRGRFYDSPMTKSAEENPSTGYVDYSRLSTIDYGYLVYSENASTEVSTALADSFSLAAQAFSVVAGLFSYMVFPGISIGLLLCIPIIISLVFAVIKLIKKGG